MENEGRRCGGGEQLVGSHFTGVDMLPESRQRRIWINVYINARGASYIASLIRLPTTYPYGDLAWNPRNPTEAL